MAVRFAFDKLSKGNELRQQDNETLYDLQAENLCPTV